MSRRDRLSAFAEQVGFIVRQEADAIVLEHVPCLLADGGTGFCRIEKSCDPTSGTPTDAIGGAPHGVRVTVTVGQGGRVFHANGEAIGNPIGSHDESCWDISIKRGSAESPEDDLSAIDVVHRYAKQIVGAVSAKGIPGHSFPVNQGPFNIPNTFEARSGVTPMQDQIRQQRIVIIGLGGTGACLLDLMAKTAVAEIHLCDSDELDWHDFMRAPGAPTSGEIESQRQAKLKKLSYYLAKYAPLRDGIRPHAIRVTDPAEFTEFLLTHSIDFAFVSIDQHMNGDSPRQDEVYAALSEAKVPFVDSGISIALENDQVRGAVTTSAYENGSLAWEQGIPNARVDGPIIGYRNVQLPEMNALAASLAVMEWRRRTGQYVSEPLAFLHKIRLESARVKWASQSGEAS